MQKHSPLEEGLCFGKRLIIPCSLCWSDFTWYISDDFTWYIIDDVTDSSSITHIYISWHWCTSIRVQFTKQEENKGSIRVWIGFLCDFQPTLPEWLNQRFFVNRHRWLTLLYRISIFSFFFFFTGRRTPIATRHSYRNAGRRSATSTLFKYKQYWPRKEEEMSRYLRVQLQPRSYACNVSEESARTLITKHVYCMWRNSRKKHFEILHYHRNETRLSRLRYISCFLALDRR